MSTDSTVFVNSSSTHSNTFKPSLGSSLKNKSTVMSTFNKIANTHPIKQFKNCLVKRTKYKLIRYAKGQNLFGLNDYF